MFPHDHSLGFKHPAKRIDEFLSNRQLWYLKCSKLTKLPFLHLDEERTATKVHRQLVELDILTRQDNHLNAASINGAAMAKKIVLITRHKLSLLVNLLFWWEEELNRWNDLESRKSSYAQQLEEAHPEESAEERMKKVDEAAKTMEMLQRKLPSQRQENKETSWNTTGGIRREFELRELERRMAERGVSSSEVVEDEGDLPAYRHVDN
ncbi:hypothetical protein KCU91_g7618, partial [Aureobasidium melanogenum]